MKGVDTKAYAVIAFRYQHKLLSRPHKLAVRIEKAPLRTVSKGAEGRRMTALGAFVCVWSRNDPDFDCPDEGGTIMKRLIKLLSLTLVLGLLSAFTLTASALTFTDAHGNQIELDESLEAFTENTLLGADNAARAGETNLGDLWTDALRWFAVSGAIDDAFEEDDVTAGNTKIDADADHVVALWNGGNLRADLAEGKFGAEQLAEVLPYPNKVAVVYMTGAQLLEALEAASQGLPCSENTVDACASFMQAAGLSYTVDTAVAYDAGEAYGDHWARANSLGRVTIDDVNGQPFDPEATYAVITSNANFNGMDSSYMFVEAASDDEKSTVTTAVVRDVIWMYISGELDNVIDQSYAEAQGRITVR